MPYQVGDKVVLADLEKNRHHHKLPRFLGQVLDVVEVLDREPWDGNGDQNLRIEQIDRGLYNSGRFQIADVNAIGWQLNPFAVPVMAPPMPIAIIEDKFQPGDVVVLTQDKERQGQGDIYFPIIMGKWADEGRAFVLKDKGNGTWSVVKDDGYSFVYAEEWFDMAKAVLKVGDKVWYKDHCDEDKATFIDEGRRLFYLVGGILDDGRLKVYIDNDGVMGGYMASYPPEQWVKAKGQKKAAKKAEPVLDPKVQAEKLEKLIGECVAKFAANAGGCANFYLISEKKNGEFIKLGGTGIPCHYELRGGYGDEGKGVPVAVIDSIHRRREHLPKFKQQGFIDYVTYLLNRSPWADCYLAKDFEDAEKNGIRMNLDKTANQLVGACIAMRQSSEYDSVLPVHEFLKAKRFSGDVCFLVGQHYTMDQHGNVTPICLNSGHTIMTNTMPADAVFKFFATKEFVGEDGKKPYRENKAYFNIFGSITGREEYARAKAGDVTIEEWMRKNCVAEQVGEGLAKKQVVTEASLLKLARAVKAELIKHKAKEEVAA